MSKLDFDLLRKQIDENAAEMNVAHFVLHLGEMSEDADEDPAEFTVCNSGGTSAWIEFHPKAYPALTGWEQEFVRRHELAHVYFVPLEYVHDRMIAYIRKHNEELADDFKKQLDEAEEAAGDLIAKAFTRRTA